MEIENLEIIIDSDTERAAKGLQKLKRVLKSLDKETEQSGLKKLHERLRGIASLNLTKQANALERIVKASKRLNADKIRRLADSNKAMLKPTETPASALSGSTEQVGRLERIREKSRHIVNEWKKLRGHVDGTEKAAKKTGKAFSAMTAIKTILMYSVLFSALNAITKGIKEGLDNVTRASKEANAVMTEYKTTTLQMKNALGAAAIPVLKTLHPLYQRLADSIMDVANAVNILFSVGKGSYTRATRYLDEYIKALQKAKGLLGMDEINTVGKAYDYGKMFETVNIDATSIAEAVGSLTALIGGIIAFGSVKKGITAFFAGSSAAIGRWGGGIGLCAMGVGLLVRGITDIIQNGKSLKNTLLTCFGILIAGGGAALLLGSWIPLAIAAVVAGLTAIVIWGDEIVLGLDRLEIKWGSVLDGARLKVDEFFENLAEKTDSPFLDSALDTVKAYVLSVMNWFEALTDGSIRNVRNTVDYISALFHGDFKGAWESMKIYFVDYWKGFANMAVAPINFVIECFEAYVNFFIRGINKLIDTANRVTGILGGDKLKLDTIEEVEWKGLSYLSTSADIAQTSTGISGSVGGSAVSEQNSLLREQNQLLARIASQRPEVSVTSITRGLDRQNRRAGRAVVATSY